MAIARVGLVIAAIVAAVGGVYALFRALDERAAPPIVIEDAEAIFPIVVDVRGAVVKPGAYELPPGSRMQDAVSAAGGLAATADLSTVNLARRLRDSEVIVILEIPKEGGTSPTPIDASDAPVATSEIARININTSSAAELESLPGIGEVTAQRIVEFRESNGPFRSVDDLIHVRGVSTRTIEGLRDLVTTAP